MVTFRGVVYLPKRCSGATDPTPRAQREGTRVSPSVLGLSLPLSVPVDGRSGHEKSEKTNGGLY